jgi:hypothetical protein
MGGQGLLGTPTLTGGNADVAQPTYGQNLQTSANNFQSQYGTNPYVQAAQATTQGNIQGAQAATAANRVNQSTPFGGLTYQQTGVDVQGNPIWSANQTFAPEVAGTMSQLSNQIGQNIGQGFNPNLPSTGINPGETYSDAIMRRLQPTQERAQKALDAQLANQGIMPGSEAYNQAKTLQSQQQNDQLTSAIVGGMQTGLSANQQAYQQALQNYNLPISQLGAYRSATAPTYINPYTQAAVSGPDYLGAYTTQANADLAAQNAAAAQQAGLTSGLFGLGSSAIIGSGGIGNLANTIGSGFNTVKNWFA